MPVVDGVVDGVVNGIAKSVIQRDAGAAKGVIDSRTQGCRSRVFKVFRQRAAGVGDNQVRLCGELLLRGEQLVMEILRQARQVFVRGVSGIVQVGADLRNCRPERRMRLVNRPLQFGQMGLASRFELVVPRRKHLLQLLVMMRDGLLQLLRMVFKLLRQVCDGLLAVGLDLVHCRFRNRAQVFLQRLRLLRQQVMGLVAVGFDLRDDFLGVLFGRVNGLLDMTDLLVRRGRCGAGGDRPAAYHRGRAKARAEFDLVQDAVGHSADLVPLRVKLLDLHFIDVHRLPSLFRVLPSTTSHHFLIR
jgi:hypothetical protein